MRGVNRVIIVGTFGKDAEIRFLPSGKAVASFSLATTEEWKDTNGQKQSQTEWHRCTAFDKLAEIIGEYCSKGSKVYIEGSIHTRKYQDKSTGQDRYSTEIKVSQLQMLGGGEEKQQGQPRQQAPSKPADDFDDKELPF